MSIQVIKQKNQVMVVVMVSGKTITGLMMETGKFLMELQQTLNIALYAAVSMNIMRVMTVVMIPAIVVEILKQ